MKDCILGIFWPRKAIFEFLRDHGCRASDLDDVRLFKEQNLARAQIVDLVFTRLSESDDGGLGQFRSMLKALIGWTHFDSYYFDSLKKLDRKSAEYQLNHLRQLVEIRDGAAKDARQRRDAAEQRAQASSSARDALRARFLELHGGSIRPQERGFKFESLLRELLVLENLEAVGSFRCVGEQIDGGLKFDGENYLIEAKWHEKSASTEPLYAFAHKIEGKMYGRGVFVSINGFMPDPVRALTNGKATKSVLVDGEDLALVLEGHLTFKSMLDCKVRAAQLRGEVYIHPITGKAKS